MINQNLLLTGDDGYNLTKSLRFRASASAYMNRTPASASNQTTWTFSTWVKRGELSSSGTYTLLSATSASPETRTIITFESDGSLDFFYYNGTSYPFITQTSAVYRDPAAWYHIVVAYDSTQATSSNRIKMYVNGSQITAFQTATYPSQNTTSDINSTKVHNIGRRGAAGNDRYFDGYMAEVHFVDGQALTPSSFGETDPTTGVWKAKKYSGIYGTNGFYLPFTDVATTSGSNAGLGKDFSGNGNYWNTNNISVTAGITYDSMNDVPTLTSATQANYCVLNPTDKDPDITISNGNLTATAATGVHNNARTTMGCGTTGYWYMEFTYTGSIGGSTAIAVGLYDPAFRIDNGTHPVTTGDGFYGLYASAGAPYMYTNGGNPSVAVSGGSAGDILQLAYDVAGGKLWFGLNNVWYDSSGGTTGNPSTGANATITTVATNRIFGFDIVSNTINFNFGQRPFSYTPPTGFVALNTFNLPEPSIKAGNKYFDIKTYDGTSASQSITGLAFQPDFLWFKSRNAANHHILVDAVRGTTKNLYTSLTDAEATVTDRLLSFDSAGFTVGADAGRGVNYSGQTQVAWAWDANGTGSSNTAGSITSTVSANPTAGFSVVTYTGNGTSGATVGHGLGVAPKMIIIKRRDGTEAWPVYHASLPSAAYYLRLNGTDAQDTATSFMNNTAPSSSVFTLGNGGFSNTNTWTYVAYCFAEVAGYSKFGSYTGNGSTDGTFVHLGFRPKYMMIKRTDTADSWVIMDTSRNPYNAVNLWLQAEGSNAESTLGTPQFDFISNGMKLRGSSSTDNASGGTYIYMAFAENPFKYSLAR